MTTQNTTDYLFLVAVNDEDRKVLAVSKDKFETMNYADCYNNFGQQIGHEDAGDYHPDNQHSDFIEGDEEVLTECKGYTYWDGHNWKTAIIQHDIEQAVTHTVLEETGEYEKAMEEKEYDREGFGRTFYKAGEYTVIHSYYQGAWYDYVILHNEDHEHLLEAIAR